MTALQRVLTYRPVAPGFWNGQDAVVGAATAWEAADDSVSDGDSSYFSLAGGGNISFAYAGFSNLRPQYVSVVVTHRVVIYQIAPAANAAIYVGLSANGFDPLNWADPSWVPTVAPANPIGVEFQSGLGYAATTTRYDLNPFTGLAWAAGDLNGTEIYVAASTWPVAAQRVRVTKVSLILEFHLVATAGPAQPKVVPTSPQVNHMPWSPAL